VYQVGNQYIVNRGTYLEEPRKTTNTFGFDS